MNFAILEDHKVKVKVGKKIKKYLDLAREQKKIVERVMVILDLVNMVRMLPKG